MKKLIRLTESDLHRIVKESVINVLVEAYQGILDNDREDELSREALRKGFNYIAYHSTDIEDLTFFNLRDTGIHFGSRKAAEDRGNTRDASYIHEYFLKIVKPYVVEKDFDWERDHSENDFPSTEEFEKWENENFPDFYLKNQGFNYKYYDDNGEWVGWRSVQEMLADEGYDCIIYRNEVEDVGNYSVCMFNPNNIKLASTTYDDNGNEIPLEQRFDTSTDDVRY